jgi:predicted XRE-type DNA-binding protein
MTARTNRSGASRKIRAEKSVGNVFADLGFPHPEQELLKARLTLQIYRLIKKRGLKQTEAGIILGIKQPHVSALMRNRSGSFSVERLMDFLTALGKTWKSPSDPHAKNMGKCPLLHSRRMPKLLGQYPVGRLRSRWRCSPQSLKNKVLRYRVRTILPAQTVPRGTVLQFA